MSKLLKIPWTISLTTIIITILTYSAHISSTKKVRLCVASVDPIKLSSQCVMCERRQFPITVIDCTGITKVNELIANPLTVQEATCLIYNCRRQVPDFVPEPFKDSVSQAARAHYYPAASGARNYEVMQPPDFFGAYSPMLMKMMYKDRMRYFSG